MSIQDEALSGRVRNAIAQDKRISGQAIAVRVAESEVFLKGVVDTQEQLDLTIMVANGIPGIKRVNVDELRSREVSE